MLERDLEKHFIAQLRKMRTVHKKLSQHFARGEAGWPDRMVMLPGGAVYFVELKQEKGHTTPAQERIHRRLRNMGQYVVVLAGKREVDLWLTWIRVAHHET